MCIRDSNSSSVDSRGRSMAQVRMQMEEAKIRAQLVRRRTSALADNVANSSFVILDVHNWCRIENRGRNESLTAEIAAIKLDLQSGITGEFHRLVRPPREAIFGKASEIKRLSEKWHKLDLFINEDDQDDDPFSMDYEGIVQDFLAFLSSKDLSLIHI